MEVVSLLKKIDSKLQISGRNEFRISVKEQKEYLNSFGEPKDAIERSYYQYLCQNYLKKGVVSKFTAFGAFFIYPILKRKYRKDGIVKKQGAADAVFLPDGKLIDIVPREVKDTYKRIDIENSKGYYLDQDSMDYIHKIEKRYHKDWLYKLKILVKIARYNYLICALKPKALIVCNEYSFTSSVMSEFCAQKEIALINVMHGEKLFSLQNAFFYFPKCYVWNKYYITLFNMLRAKCDEYIIQLPDSMKIPNSEKDKSIDYTYYLQDESGPVLDTILKNMEILQNKGFSVAIRPHPRYTNKRDLDNCDINVEDNSEITILNSLKRCRCAISFCSTVLNQAYYNNINIVIDDLSRPNEYKILLEKEYIMMKVKHDLLSKIMLKMKEDK